MESRILLDSVNANFESIWHAAQVFTHQIFHGFWLLSDLHCTSVFEFSTNRSLFVLQDVSVEDFHKNLMKDSLLHCTK